MNQQMKEPLTTPELNRLFTTLQSIFFKSQKLAILYGSPFYNPQNALTQFELDPLNLNRPIQELFWHWLMQPQKLWESQIDLWQQQVKLIQNNMLRLMGYSVPSLITEDKSDRRFQHQAWQTPGFDWIKQSYLLTARWLETLMNDLPLEKLNQHDIEKLKFYTQQLIDAASPSNFVFTNPEVLYATLKSGGENLLKGLEHFLTDVYRGQGQLSIKMTDFDAFELGKNIAATPGKVIYQNELMQLIHYQATTSEVHSTPLLIVPPWINKYYILDLQSHNSFVKWVIDQGHSVFLISWVNPDNHLADKTFEDYLLQGPLAALEVVKEVTEQPQVNTVGYCLGGTLLAITLAYLAAQEQQQQIASATFFTTLLDFSHPGELGIFIDEQQIESLERRMSAQGYLEANAMATTFSLLRANDLIWSFYVNNYLLGKTPPPFDLLYWNSDSTRMPAKMHSFYLRNMYLKNLLRQSNGISLNGVGIDLTQVKTPAYFVSTLNDHIAPWKGTFMGKNLFSGPVKFVLSGSGHIAGIINPPSKNKYFYYTNSKSKTTKNPETWFNNAKQQPGSWWPDWAQWLSQHSGDKIAARVPGETGMILEDAPGSYVKLSILQHY